jgi:Cytochrome P460
VPDSPKMQPNHGILQPAAWLAAGTGTILPRMLTKLSVALIGALLLISMLAFRQETAPSTNTPTYTSDGQLKFPDHYREWVYLTTGIDMSYNPALQSADHSMFDNVFVNPEAYKAFTQTGTWPDKTVLVLEVRGAQSKGSINQKGHYQGTDVMGLEVHVKDEARFSGKWAFFGFDNETSAKMIAQNMDCYSCHSEHGAVDTTFVQFYPTLLEIAKKKGTLSAGYKKESAATPAK